MSMSNTHAARGFYLGLAIGQLWLTVVGTAFVSFIWVVGRNSTEVALLVGGTILIGLLLLSGAISLLRSARRLPSQASAENSAAGRKIGRRFGLVVLAEIVVIGAVNVALGMTNHGIWITPVTYLFVGLHFIPLAFVFRVQPYIALGILWVAVVVGTLVAFPATTMVGQGISAWVVIPVVGCGISTWPVIAYILMKHLGNLRAAHSLVVPTQG